MKEVLNDGQQGYHDLYIDVVRDRIDIESLLIDGKVRFPNGDVQNFSITEPSPEPRLHRILAYGDGLFRVKITAYATTVDGRDVILDVPEYTFRAEAPDSAGEEADAEQPVDLESQIVAETAMTEMPAAPPEEPGMDDATLYMLIGVINGSIILVGVLVIVIIIWRRKKAANKASAPVEPKSGSAEPADKKPGFLAGLLGKFKKNKDPGPGNE